MKSLSSSIAFCAAALLAADAHVEAQKQARAPMRFQAMDSNRDRRITRNEWRGTDQSFRQHDWNGDGVLSGDEVRPGAERPAAGVEATDFDSPEREYEFNDWTTRGFAALDHNNDRRITRDEWHFAREGFRRADHNGDGVISRAEFLNTDLVDDDRGDLFVYLDANNDRRVSRSEWHGGTAAFNALDTNKDGVLTRAELDGDDAPPEDLFVSVDVNHDGSIALNEWHWSRQSFDQRDANRDGRLSRAEFNGAGSTAARSPAYRAGYERGLVEGRQAGKEDGARRTWDLEGQQELEQADSGYDARVGPRAEYQAGYREAFRSAYREGFLAP
jgi:Ca2+-binding EF-hand superfamily protein